VTPACVRQRVCWRRTLRVRLAPVAVVVLPFCCGDPVLVCRAGVVITLPTLNAAAQCRAAMGDGAELALCWSPRISVRSVPMSGVPVPPGRALNVAMLVRRVVLGSCCLKRVVFRCDRLPGRSASTSPVRGRHHVVFEPGPTDGPVIITSVIKCRANGQRVREASARGRRSRLRNRVPQLGRYHRVGQSDMSSKGFTVASWTEFERQRTESWLNTIRRREERALVITVDRERQHELLVAVCGYDSNASQPSVPAAVQGAWKATEFAESRTECTPTPGRTLDAVHGHRSCSKRRHADSVNRCLGCEG